MKTLLTILLIIICFSSQATNRYFSSSTGNDATGSGTIGAPYASITKLNSVMSSFSAGDSVLFKAGDVFFGKIVLARSDLKFGRYGSGNKPIITGFVTVTAFGSLGGNIWESSAIIGGRSALECVTVNGVFRPKGRFPNASAANGGYLTIDNHTSTSIVDASLPSFANPGAEVVIKTKRYIIERRIITSKPTSTSIAFAATTYAPINGWGYFIQNSASTLDTLTEWYYNPTTKKLRMYATSSPGTAVKAAVLDTLVFTNSRSNISFSNIQFEGSGADGIYITGGSNISTTDCNFFNMGDRAVYNPFENTSIYTSLRDSLIGIGDIGVETNSSKITIESSVVRNVGIFPGMSGSGEGFHANAYAFRHADSNITIKYCDIRNVGMSAVGIKNDESQPNANNWVIYNNRIDSTNIIKDDDGAIYTWGGGAIPPTYRNRIIRGNVITNTLGNKTGTADDYSSGYGIYLDINSRHIRVDSNYVENSGRAGIFLNFYSERDTVMDNTLYNNGTRIGADPTLGCGIFSNEDETRRVRNNVIKRNKIWALGTQYLVTARNTGSSTFAPGVMDSNYYSHLNTKTSPFSTRTSAGTVAKTLATWRNLGLDARGDTILTTSTSVLKKEYSSTGAVKIIDLGGYNWIDAKRTSYSKFIALPPYRSIALKRGTLDGSIPPTVNIYTPIDGSTLESNTNIQINATASDANGTIANVEFYRNGTLINTDASSPYSYTMTSVAPGDYTLTAKATDNEGLTTTSTPILIHVVNTKPTISLTAPTNGTSYVTGASVSMTATAADANGTISKVNFYVDGIFKGTDNSSPYNASWTSTAGGHSLTAVAVDNNGDSTTSAAVSITASTTNQVPTVSITLPTKDTTMVGSGSVHFTAVASDPDGTVVNVRFYDNLVFFWNETTAPWDFTRTISGIGVHSITAVAIDNGGDSTRSAPRYITIGSPNQKPTGSITDPNSDSSYEAPATFTVTVEAADSDGTVSAVHLYKNGIFAGSDGSSPYTFLQSALTEGGYSFTAWIIDNDGDSTQTNTINPTVITPSTPGPDSLAASARIVSQILCNGGQGTIEVTATGGEEPYTGTGTFTATGGYHEYYISDANGLKDTARISLYEPGALSATVDTTAITNYGGTSTLTVNTAGGTPAFQYSINGGTSWQASNIFIVNAGTYTIQIKDANLCTTSVSFTVHQPAPTCNCIIRGKKKIIYL